MKEKLIRISIGYFAAGQTQNTMWALTKKNAL